MIVGRGIIAKAFLKKEIEWDSFIVFASGVSNSREERQSEYQRETDLLNSFLSTNKTLIYFSTTSVFDESKLDSTYVKYKKTTEAYIKKNWKQYIILRLPIVLSHHNNPHQLFGYIKSAIVQNRKLTLYKNASRHMYDAEDIAPAASAIVEYMLKEKLRKLVVNVGFPSALSMNRLAEIICEMYPDVNIEFKDKGYSYDTDFSVFQSIAQNLSLRSSNSEVLLKYYLQEI